MRLLWCFVIACLGVVLLTSGCSRRVAQPWDVDLPPERSSRPPLPSVTELVPALDDPDPDIRLAAVISLAMQAEQAKPAVAKLLERLRDEHPLVRQAAADTLGTLQAVEAVEPLIALLHDGSVDVRRSAALALGKIGPAASRASEALAKALMDSDEDVRWAATLALGQIGPAARPAVAALREAARQADSETKRRIADSLKKIEEPAP
jgi:HEAT repeat protein